MNNKQELLNYVKNNWRKIPYLCNMPEEEINEKAEEETSQKTPDEK